jgi:hypothetical protein
MVKKSTKKSTKKVVKKKARKVKVPRMGMVSDAVKHGVKAGGEKLIEVGAAHAKKKALEFLGKGVGMIK